MKMLREGIRSLLIVFATQYDILVVEKTNDRKEEVKACVVRTAFIRNK